MGERSGVTDEEWEVIGPLLPPEHGRGCRPAQDNRAYFEGMMWIARTGAQWRHLPDEYGKWNSVFRRYRRWVTTGVFDAMLETLAELAGRDTAADMIDSTVVRAHHCAVGIKRGLSKPGRLADRAGGFTTKLHARCDARGLPPGFVLTPGQAHDVQGFAPLFRMITDRIEAFLADRGYDADAIRKEIEAADAEAVIPARVNRLNPAPHDRSKYKPRQIQMAQPHRAAVQPLKNWRRVATRYDKTKESHLGFVALASVKLWIPFVHET